MTKHTPKENRDTITQLLQDLNEAMQLRQINEQLRLELIETKRQRDELRAK